MMLREYQLTNFKAFGGPETMPIRPITLIYGPNSSGKSSVLQSLLLLKQTLQEAENNEILLLPRGNLINLGSYREFIHRHDVSQPFSFKVVLDIDDLKNMTNFKQPLSENLLDNNYLGLQFAFNYDENIGNIVLSNVQLFIGEDPLPVAIYKPQKIEKRFRKSSSRWAVGNDSFPLNEFQDIDDYDLPQEIDDEVLEGFLKLDSIDYKHSLWQAWWEKYSSLLPREADKELIKILEDLKLQESFKDTQRETWRELLEEQSKSLKKDVEQLNNSSRETIENKLNQLESLRRLESHFDNYSFQLIQEDLCKIHEDLSNKSGFDKFDVLSYRNFFPVECVNLRDKKDSSDSEVWKLSDIYKLCWTPEFSVLTMLASSGFRSFLNDLVYIGPLRDNPERFYILSDNLSKQVGKSGKMLPDILFKDQNLLKQLNNQLNRFGLEYELKISRLTVEDYGNTDFFALRLIDKYTGVNVSIADVGFGISQVLPIIVQSMLSRKSTLLIEQPEIHIHPRLQAELGSLLAECTKPPFDNQFIIETHSEHLMLRLQKLIRKGELKPDDVSVIYVDRGSDGSKCLHLRLDEEGDFIDEWPDGFFEEDFNEIFG